MPLVLKTLKRTHTQTCERPVIRVDLEVYNKLMEVSEETGGSIKAVATKMINYAYDEIVYDY